MASVVPQIAAPSLHLPFQVLLHLHAHLTPFAIIGQIGCFLLKVAHHSHLVSPHYPPTIFLIFLSLPPSFVGQFRLLYPTYRATLLALHFVSVLVQIVRPFLGFHGNLKGRVCCPKATIGAFHSLLFLGRSLLCPAFGFCQPSICPLFSFSALTPTFVRSLWNNFSIPSIAPFLQSKFL